jgi:hypothetical protein
MALVIGGAIEGLVRYRISDDDFGAGHDGAFRVRNLAFNLAAGAVNGDKWQGKQTTAKKRQQQAEI